MSAVVGVGLTHVVVMTLLVVRPTAAASAAGPAPTGQAPTRSASPSGTGARDPFMPPTVPGYPAPAAPVTRRVETRLSEVALADVVVTGAVCTDARTVAVLRSVTRRSWVVGVGDHLQDARVAEVTCEAVMFERHALDPRTAHTVWRYLPPRAVQAREEGR